MRRQSGIAAFAIVWAMVLAALPVHAERGLHLIDQVPRFATVGNELRVVSKTWLYALQRAAGHLRWRGMSQGSGLSLSWRGLFGTVCHSVQPLVSKAIWRKGFLATQPSEEIPIRSAAMDALLYIQRLPARGQLSIEAFLRQAEGIIKTHTDPKKGVHAEVVPFFWGAAPRLFVYKRYTDVRLAYLPEKCVSGVVDAAFVRAYEHGQPLRPDFWLPWCETPINQPIRPVVTGGYPADPTHRQLTEPDRAAMIDLEQTVRDLAGDWLSLYRSLGRNARKDPLLKAAQIDRLYSSRNQALKATIEQCDAVLRSVRDGSPFDARCLYPELAAEVGNALEPLVIEQRRVAEGIYRLTRLYQSPIISRALTRSGARSVDTGSREFVQAKHSAPAHEQRILQLALQQLTEAKTQPVEDLVTRWLLVGEGPSQAAQSWVRLAARLGWFDPESDGSDRGAEDPFVALARQIERVENGLRGRFAELGAGVDKVNATWGERLRQWTYPDVLPWFPTLRFSQGRTWLGTDLSVKADRESWPTWLDGLIAHGDPIRLKSGKHDLDTAGGSSGSPVIPLGGVGGSIGVVRTGLHFVPNALVAAVLRARGGQPLLDELLSSATAAPGGPPLVE